MQTKTKTNVAIRFVDIDMAGHVHNSKYLVFFEQGRIDFLTQLTVDEWPWKKKGIVLGRNEIDYIKPLYLHDSVHVVTKCDHVGTKSFTLSYELYVTKADGTEELTTKGRSILVCMDFDKDASVLVFEEWKDALMLSMESYK